MRREEQGGVRLARAQQLRIGKERKEGQGIVVQGSAGQGRAGQERDKSREMHGKARKKKEERGRYTLTHKQQ